MSQRNSQRAPSRGQVRWGCVGLLKAPQHFRIGIDSNCSYFLRAISSIPRFLRVVYSCSWSHCEMTQNSLVLPRWWSWYWGGYLLWDWRSILPVPTQWRCCGLLLPKEHRNVFWVHSWLSHKNFWQLCIDCYSRCLVFVPPLQICLPGSICSS